MEKNKNKTKNESSDTSKSQRKISHADESLKSDYRPTQYGSTDRDRKEDKNLKEKNNISKI